GDQYELVGYDEYGRPVYRPVAPQQAPQQYDPYAQQQGYGYDPYATGGRQQQAVPSYDPYAAGGHQGGAPAQPYDPYGQAAASGQQPRVAEQTAYIPQQVGPAEATEATEATEAPETQAPDASARSQRDYRTEQFAFVEEPDGDSEDVIDWMAFTENR